MNEILHLFRLQKIDSQLDQIESRLAEITRIFESDESLQQAENRVKENLAILDQAKRNLHVRENAVEAQKIKLETDEASLYSNLIRNPKELQDLQNKVASLKRHLSTLEDLQLEAMLEVEEAEKVLQIVLVDQTNVQATFTVQKAGLLGERAQLLRNQERLITEREAITATISIENQQLYARLRKQKRGVAVSSVNEGACTACGAVLRPAEIQEARSALQNAYCSSCGRILYAG